MPSPKLSQVITPAKVTYRPIEAQASELNYIAYHRSILLDRLAQIQAELAALDRRRATIDAAIVATYMPPVVDTQITGTDVPAEPGDTQDTP